jgi:uncharacterized protein
MVSPCLDPVLWTEFGAKSPLPSTPGSTLTELVPHDELRRRLGAPGDFAQAYVIAHEIGHHLQTLDGTSERAPGAERRGLLEIGDIEEALNAAAAIGDDRLQSMARGTVSPETFSHGSSAQRVRWFRTGYQVGDRRACDTFAAGRL